MEFERAADELRDRAAPQGDLEAGGRDWSQLGALDQIGPYTDSIHYVLPKLLLVAQAFASQPDNSASTEKNDAPNGQELAYGIAPGTKRVAMVDPQEAPSPVEELFEDIKQHHQHPGVASYFRSLGNWPAFLEAIWHEIRPQVGTDTYNARKSSLTGQAEQAISPLLRRAVARPTIPDDITAILWVFERRLIPDLLLDVTMIEALLGRTTVTGGSSFSVAKGVL
ncbi:hypothetical protein FIV42_07550 [Persicimonas caeni]|uniref:Uncharacterized protein n=1 Tax=Persicimonas caeni TaxID=2292766 RepID=A0A4Y6PQJ5_PERCE|nr:hypothetical protein [Persicimonas caeni]QDG50594.1 hypothetical protein FIV42_07550 [Persicimonas caeni]QED31815.1 hypothetical protein FRD00_07545 [Persicimonas caeni]